MRCEYCYHCQQEEARSRGQTLIPYGNTTLVLEQDEKLIQYHDEQRQSTIRAILKKDGSQQWVEEIPDAIH